MVVHLIDKQKFKAALVFTHDEIMVITNHT